MFTEMNNQQDVIVVGGGLAGLTTAVYLARAGRSVTVLEKARAPGGRAQTQAQDGFLFNLGAHALYNDGEGMQVLRDLRIPFSGSKPDVAKTSFVVQNGRLWPSPVDPITLLRSKMLTWREKFALMRALMAIMRTPPAEVRDVPLQTWIARQTGSATVQQILQMLGQVTTYSNDPTRLSTAVYLQQMQYTLKNNVTYLDGGWQTLVDGLLRAAEGAGAAIKPGVRVTAVHETEGGVTVGTATGDTYLAAAVVVATDPNTAARLLPGHEPVETAAETAVPVRIAVLDVGLHRLPHPNRTFVLGMDDPTYLSVHSRDAQLAPGGGELIHLAKYLAPGEASGAAVREELESLLDLVQPGWRAEVVTQRYLPQMTVVSALATAVGDGQAGRPPVALTDRLYIAGDWVGPHGWLVDASFASARAVAHCLLHHTPAVRLREPLRM